MERVFVALRAIVFAGGFFLLWFWVALLVRSLDSSLGGPLPAWTETLGWVMMGLGGALAVWCVSVFVTEGLGTPAIFDPPRLLVARGPYRFARNPMYVGAGTLLTGFGLQLRSPAIVLLIPIWALLAHLMVVAYEEPGLRRRFGPPYDEYCRKTPRWLPRLREHAGAVSVALLLVPGLFQAAPSEKPNFSGEWTLNRAKSEFGPVPGPDSQIDLVEHDEPVLRIRTKRAHGDRKSEGEWSCRIDEGPCKVSLVGTSLKLGSHVRWDGAVLVFESQGDYDGRTVRMLDRWSLSGDGSVLTIARRLGNQLGEAHQTLVLEKTGVDHEAIRH